MKALFVFGSPDDGRGIVKIAPDGGTNILLGGSSNLGPYMQPRIQTETFRFCISGDGGPQKFSIPLFPDVIVNEISDPDTHDVALRRSVEFIKQQKKPALNEPVRVMETRRDIIADKLQGIDGVIMPQTYRLEPRSPEDVVAAIDSAQLSYPVIFRQAGDHGGVSTSLIQSRNDIDKEMYQYALDGRAYYITAFVDYINKADGCYRKYRLVMIDGKVYLRHMIVSDTWMIHSSSRKFMQANKQYQQEEAQLLQNFQSKHAQKLATPLAEIYRRVGLDYFGIDCSINDEGQLLIFEANANMNVLPNTVKSPNVWDAPIETIKLAIEQLIRKKASV